MANFSISVEGEKWPPFPWLKSRGPIETYRRLTEIQFVFIFPWLKSRGPIETYC